MDLVAIALYVSTGACLFGGVAALLYSLIND